MARLPVIVGFGGYSAAGRSSFHQAYQRIVLDKLSADKKAETIAGLAVMMKLVTVKGSEYVTDESEHLSRTELVARFGDTVCESTLVRPINASYFDVNQVPQQQTISLDKTDQKALCFELPKRKLPASIPDRWQVSELDERNVRVVVADSMIRTASHYESSVHAAGQLPTGFDPADLYSSRFHPRALQLAVIGASDAVNSLGVDWQKIVQHVAPDEIGAYSSSIMSQLDDNGLGGLLQSRLRGDRVSTKQLALGLSSMTSDFVNAYVLGNLGATGSIVGACASFLYNLRAGMEDIQSGRRRVVVVGGSEAPILPEVVEGYATMGALATTEKLCRLDGSSTTDLRRSSRPFGDNCGFVIAESTQHVVLMDDALAIELGADIHGAVADVFTSADGFKKSISAPGPGNYLTFAKAVASANSLLGEKALAERSFVQAHGSSTPQNRVTESEIFDRIAGVFNIKQWPVTAVKAFLGHSLAPASGDQLINTLGIFAHGILPGINTIDRVADDVLQERLSISTEHRELTSPMDIAFLNSKGFGGNNATASILSPAITEKMLAKRHGQKAMAAYQIKRALTREKANNYHEEFLKGNYQVIYKYGEDMLDEKSIEIDQNSLRIPGYGEPINLDKENIYKDMM
jgi:acetoacetyl-[acyl-carrier protein] synthase